MSKISWGCPFDRNGSFLPRELAAFEKIIIISNSSLAVCDLQGSINVINMIPYTVLIYRYGTICRYGTGTDQRGKDADEINLLYLIDSRYLRYRTRLDMAVSDLVGTVGIGLRWIVKKN